MPTDPKDNKGGDLAEITDLVGKKPKGTVVKRKNDTRAQQARAEVDKVRLVNSTRQQFTLKTLRNKAAAWAAQEKADIESGRKAVPDSSLEKYMAEKKTGKDLGEKEPGATKAQAYFRRDQVKVARELNPVWKAAHSKEFKDLGEKNPGATAARVEARKNSRDFVDAAKQTNVVQNKGFKDLGEKFRGETKEQSKFNREMIPKFREINKTVNAIAEGRLGDPSPMLPGSMAEKNKPLKTAGVKTDLVRHDPGKIVNTPADRAKPTLQTKAFRKALAEDYKAGRARGPRGAAEMNQLRNAFKYSGTSGAKTQTPTAEAQQTVGLMKTKPRYPEVDMGRVRANVTRNRNDAMDKLTSKNWGELKNPSGVSERTQQHHLQSREFVHPPEAPGKDLGRAVTNTISRDPEGAPSLLKLAKSRAAKGQSIAGEPDNLDASPSKKPRLNAKASRLATKAKARGGIPGGGPEDQGRVESDLHSNLEKINEHTWGINKRLEPGDL